MKTLTAILFLLPGLAAAPQEGKKYDLKFTWQPIVGHKTKLSEDVTESMNLAIRVGDQVVNQQKRKEIRRFRAVEEILEVKGKDAVRKTWTFSKAVRNVSGQDVPYGFEGKTVVVTRVPDGKAEFAFAEGGKPSADDEKVLSGLFSEKREKKEGDPDPNEILAPPTPVAVGESWKPDPVKLFELLMKDGLDQADKESIKGEFTLRSIDKREGVEFARVTGNVDFRMIAMGPMPLKKPLPCTFQFQLTACRDGSRPDGVMKMTMLMKGTSNAKPPNAPQEVTLDIDAQVEGELRKTTLK